MSTVTINNNRKIETFKSNFSGQVILPTDAAYERARQVWNGMISKRPALIARCNNVEDVVKSIRFARGNDLLVSIRGGGHNVAGYAVCDDGIVIDMTNMKRVDVNLEAQTVRVEAGALWGDVDPKTQGHGLATPGG